MQLVFSLVRKKCLCAFVCLLTFIPLANATFSDDLRLIQKHFSPILLEQENTKTIILAELQGRVMVSTFGGDNASSLGWINRDYLQKGHSKQNATIGGASRLLFGPETGPYSFFFEPGKQQTADNVVIPAAFSTIPFTLVARDQSHAHFQQQITVQNHFGYNFIVEIERTIELFSRQQISQKLGVEIAPEIKQVGFGASTSIRNVGGQKWSLNTGAPSIWELGAFNTSAQTTVIIPIKNQLLSMKQYFSPNKATHLRVTDDFVYYKADAKYMNKIGVPPQNTVPIFGSYDASKGLLTIVQFEFIQTEKHYNNSTWDKSNYQPYDGDVINVFNDGEVDGVAIFGPFYELETSSSAKALSIGQRSDHFQNTFHFNGSKDQLELLAEQLLGVSLKTTEQIFKH